MFSYTTAHAPAVRVSINGTPYDVPRFLHAEFKAWVADRQRAIRKDAEEPLPDPETRARFRLYYQPPPIDVTAVAQELTTPEGMEQLLRTCLTAAKVPAEQVESFIANVDPLLQRQLADELLSGNGMIAEQKQASGDPGSGADPLPGAPPTSGGSPETTGTTSPTSGEPTPGATKTA